MLALPVYNLEVQTEHVYHIGPNAVLVHNVSPGYFSRKDFIVYRSLDGTYIGRTVGSLAYRYGAAASDYVPLYENLTYKEARGLEQHEIDARGGVDGEGHKKLRNEKNGIEPSRTDKNARSYRRAATNYLKRIASIKTCP
jgi:hypothetical protein